MKKILHAAPGTAIYIQQTARAYFEQNMLDKFCTTFALNDEKFIVQLLKKYVSSFYNQLGRRKITEVPVSFVRSKAIRELIRTVASRYTNANLTDKIWEWSELSFDRWVADQLTESNKAVHVYEHAGLFSLERAKSLGIIAIYEQPSQHHALFTSIVREQIEKYPELDGVNTGLLIDEKSVRRNARRDQELSVADIIVCNSSFTKRSLTIAGIPDEKIIMVPYGFPETVEKKEFKKKPVIFLNAGTQSLRKGSHLFYKAWNECNFREDDAELWLLGKMNLPDHFPNGLKGKVTIKASIPRSELMELYQQTDVFVLPTLADGFGMVISESMSRGVPVITTRNSCGGDFITHGENGWLVETGDIDSLREQLLWCVQNKNVLGEVGKKAQQTAANWQWSDFRSNLTTRLSEKIGK